MEPHERYASARDFADDLAAWREHRPIRARPPSLTYRARKFVRRHRGGVAAGMIALLAVIAGGVGTVWQAHVARIEGERAREAAARATAQSDFMSRLFGDALATGSNADALRLLERGQRLLDGFADRPPRVRAELMMRWSLLLLSRDRPREALDLLERAMALVPDDAAFVQNLRCRSITMRLALGQHEVVSSIVADAERDAAQWSVTVLAECFDRSATVHADRGDPARALASLERATAAYREREGDDSVNAWRTLRRRAGLEIGLGRLDDAERHLDEYLAFATAAHLDEDTAFASVHGERARLLRLQSRLPQALAAAQRELELRAARGPDDIYKAAPNANIANLQALLGQTDAARAHFAEAERILDQSNTRTMAPAIWLSHARWLIAWGDVDAAEARLDWAEAALIAQREPAHPELARVAYLRSLLRVARGDVVAGRNDLAAAIEQLRVAGPSVAMHLPRALTDQARFALDAGDAAAAIRSARAALALNAPEYERNDTRAVLADAERAQRRR
jgi:serine/threonine-protein kinase